MYLKALPSAVLADLFTGLVHYSKLTGNLIINVGISNLNVKGKWRIEVKMLFKEVLAASFNFTAEVGLN